MPRQPTLLGSARHCGASWVRIQGRQGAWGTLLTWTSCFRSAKAVCCRTLHLGDACRVCKAPAHTTPLALLLATLAALGVIPLPACPVQEMAARRSVDEVLVEHMESGRLRPVMDCTSVYVRLLDFSREQQLRAAATEVAATSLRVPLYMGAATLGTRHLAAMRQGQASSGRTYAEVCLCQCMRWAQAGGLVCTHDN